MKNRGKSFGLCRRSSAFFTPCKSPIKLGCAHRGGKHRSSIDWNWTVLAQCANGSCLIGRQRASTLKRWRFFNRYLIETSRSVLAASPGTPPGYGNMGGDRYCPSGFDESTNNRSVSHTKLLSAYRIKPGNKSHPFYKYSNSL